MRSGGPLAYKNSKDDGIVLGADFNNQPGVLIEVLECEPASLKDGFTLTDFPPLDLESNPPSRLTRTVFSTSTL